MPFFTKQKLVQKKPVLDISESEQQQRLFLKKMKQIPVKRLPVAVSLFKDYSEPFVFTKPVPSNPKIRNCLRECYKPNIENIQKIMDIKLTEEQADFIENAINNKAIFFYGKTCVFVALYARNYKRTFLVSMSKILCQSCAVSSVDVPCDSDVIFYLMYFSSTIFWFFFLAASLKRVQMSQSLS